MGVIQAGSSATGLRLLLTSYYWLDLDTHIEP